MILGARGIELKTPDELRQMRRAGLVVARAIAAVVAQARPGVSTAELDAVAGDESVRVVVIGAEGKAFSAGHDLKQMRAEPSLGYYEALFAQCARMMVSIQRLPVPVIARVQGIATAAGCQLVAACDLAVAASSARFAVSGINFGLFCSSPSVALSRNLARKAAFEAPVAFDPEPAARASDPTRSD